MTNKNYTINIIAAGEDFAEKIDSLTTVLTGTTDTELIDQAAAIVADRGYAVLRDSDGGCCVVDGEAIAITVEPPEDDEVEGEAAPPYTVVFDNGGGVTLWLPEYAHHYDGYVGCIEQAARDLAVYLHNPDTSDWEGDDPAARFEDTDGYLVYDSVADIMAAANEPIGWLNVIDFAAALRKELDGNDTDTLSAKLKAAIARSVSHTEVVHVDVEDCHDTIDLLAMIADYDGYADASDYVDVWGTDPDGHEWRLYLHYTDDEDDYCDED